MRKVDGKSFRDLYRCMQLTGDRYPSQVCWNIHLQLTCGHRNLFLPRKQ